MHQENVATHTLDQFGLKVPITYAEVTITVIALGFFILMMLISSIKIATPEYVLRWHGEEVGNLEYALDERILAATILMLSLTSIIDLTIPVWIYLTKEKYQTKASDILYLVFEGTLMSLFFFMLIGFTTYVTGSVSGQHEIINNVCHSCSIVELIFYRLFWYIFLYLGFGFLLLLVHFLLWIWLFKHTKKELAGKALTKSKTHAILYNAMKLLFGSSELDLMLGKPHQEKEDDFFLGGTSPYESDDEGTVTKLAKESEGGERTSFQKELLRICEKVMQDENIRLDDIDLKGDEEEVAPNNDAPAPQPTVPDTKPQNDNTKIMSKKQILKQKLKKRGSRQKQPSKTA
ncbi:hypothetical protein Ciccas_003248 [Cichlidogyrus casuarinus]|uniref:Uncharacterized protein n=1 Tax=Cichlidogyrus casuarinus TaxID=1844966 RepID=A0ABD2QEW6_9PLAT